VYVLLGAPGAGKTEAFKREAGEEGGHYTTARDFLTFDPEPDREGKTLFIDGLDEMRAGASGGRTPFDAIRAKLQRLGRPPFRLSCRAADWFGDNDRERLSAVAPNREVRVLRLDPLSEAGVLDILKRNHDVDDPAAFVAEAREPGVEDLLLNPQNLRMLAEAVAEADGWPRTRTETFHMACRKLVSEENLERQVACRGTFDTKALLDGAGDLCALVLLAGKAGVTLPGTRPDASHPALGQFPVGDTEFLRRAVGTSLFASLSEGRMAPAHRQIAEFLAARRLAARIADGLPVGRVLSLIAGFDGGVISEFRGLAAWLAALSQPARGEIIGRDPLGVALYGDVQQLGLHEKRLLLKALRREIDGNPWLTSYTSSDSPLRSIVGPGLEDDMRQALTDPARDEAHQSFVLLIAEAIRDAAAFPELADPLMAIVRDDSWRPTIRCAALEAYMRARQDDPRIPVTLRRLLDDVHSGAVPTRDDHLLGTLLAELYPDDLPVADVVGYLREPAQRNLWTRYGRFWTDGLIEKSTVRQMVQLLDLLRVPMERVRAEVGESPGDVDLVVRPPIVLLRHLLECSPQSVSQEQIAYWLDFAAWVVLHVGGWVGDAEFFRNWLSGQPDTYKAIVKSGVTRCREDGDFSSCMRRAKLRLFLLQPCPPQDYGGWCADQALGSANPSVARWFVGEAAAFVFRSRGPGHRERQAVARKLRGDARLGRLFEDGLRDLEEESDLGTPQEHTTPKGTRFDQFRDWVKDNESALHANECRPDLLHNLAIAYFNGFSNVRGETPRERLQDLLGPNDDLSDAALAGLRGAIRRSDLPVWTEVSKLTTEGRTHYLAYPFIVGLEELYVAAEIDDLQLSDTQTRLALAIHFTVPRLLYWHDGQRPLEWLFRTLLKRDPETVAEVLLHCAREQLRAGSESLADAHYLAHSSEYAPVARSVSIPLLKVFPVRCRTGQLPILRSLLHAACQYGDRTRFLELIDRKLALRSINVGQRVYWLAAGLFMCPKAYGNRLESYVSGKAARIHRLAEMAVDGDAVPQPLRDTWSASVLERLIRLISAYAVPHPETDIAYVRTLSIEATSSLAHFIDLLADDRSTAATKTLEALTSDELLAQWHSRLLRALHRQKSIRREANFAHPSVERVADILDGGRPASAADLWAMTVDLLSQFSRRIRDGATTDWRQYWNVDQYNRAQKPRPEDACRDALLSDLEQALTPLGVEGVKEGYYADDKRADIRLSVPGFNIPIEIKRSSHRDWWSSIRTQLISQYIRDPGTDGYGIYLVFWFGEAEPSSGRKPESPDDLRHALVESLTDRERRKISVIVIDVSKAQT